MDVMGQSFDIHSGKDFKMTLTVHHMPIYWCYITVY
jgi:hypothetical protein